MEAAKRHLGVAIVIDRMVGDLLSSGELVAVLPNIVGRRDRVCLVYPNREFLEPKVRVFVDFIAAKVEASHRGAG